MELLLSVRWRSFAADDVRVEVEPHHSIRELMTALDTACAGGWEPSQPVFLERTGQTLALDAPVFDFGLLSGDILRFDMFNVDSAPWTSPTIGVSCDVFGGPELGRSFVLAPGVHRVGHAPAPANDIVLLDPTVSDNQFTVTVDAELTVVLTPNPAARNPTIVNGVVVDASTPLQSTDTVQFGASAASIRVFERSANAGRDLLGQISFNRTPRRKIEVEVQTFEALDTAPSTPTRRRFGVLSAILPLASGIVLWAFTKQLQFLALTILSPIAVVGNSIEDRRSGRRKFEQDSVTFRAAIAVRRADVEGALQHERRLRIAQAPDLADLARRAYLRTVDLWCRQRGDDDFLRVRVGLGTVDALVVIEPERSGDPALRVEAAKGLTGLDRLVACPIVVDLAALGTVGIHGRDIDAAGTTSALVLQAATLHSPEDLAVVSLEPGGAQLESWLKWLPHSRSTTSPLALAHTAIDAPSCNALLSEMVAVARLRTSENTQRVDARWPWLLVLIHDDPSLNSAALSQLLDLAPQSGMSVVVRATSEARMPRQCRAVIRCSPPHRPAPSVVWYSDPARHDDAFEPESVTARLAERVALALAPLRDATAATSTSAIPRTVPLYAALGPLRPTPLSIAAAWTAPTAYELRAPIGFAEHGPLEIDLVAHGPHALIGGTSGAGKSELLQSIVAGLISRYPPTRLTLLFVDYKGGASSAVFSGIPHTVGYVTNLDPSLALRALISLRAELDVRMRLLQDRAKDLEEMLQLHPDEAPPALVIIVDEFATLVREVPEFVAGILDVAQRGRSLGIHLILATQRPAGSVNDNILANTNLRISLRMLDAADSTAVIGLPLAADIPVPLKGRAYARLGPRELVEFQSAFTGAALDDPANVSPIRITFFGQRRRKVSRSSNDGRSLAPPPPTAAERTRKANEEKRHTEKSPTQLKGLLDAVTMAMPDLSAPRRPWTEPLPSTITADAVDKLITSHGEPSATSRGRDVLIGLSDDPAAQTQLPARVDLELLGGLLIVGGGGSGKTTAMRTVLASAIRGATPDDVTVFVIDCASRALQTFRAMPHCAAVVTGDDLEGVTRVISLLTRETRRRRELLSHIDVQAETLTAYIEGGRRLPRIVLAVDGYPNLAAMLTSPAVRLAGAIDWVEAFQNLVAEGRSVGVHVVVTADRRQSLPAAMLSTVSARLVLRQNDEGGYADLGVPIPLIRGAEFPPGRGVLDGRLVQVASLSTEPSAAGQAKALRELIAGMSGRVPTELRTAPPDHEIVVSPSRTPLVATIGREDVTGREVVLDLTEHGARIVGQSRSGRTTTLTQIARSLVDAGTEVWTIGLRTAVGGIGRQCEAEPAAAAALLAELLELARTFPGTRRVLVVDDVDEFEDEEAAAIYRRIVSTKAVRTVCSFETRNASSYTSNGLLDEMRQQLVTLFLQPDSAIDVMQLTNDRADLRPGLKMRAGCGVLMVDHQPTLLQVAAERCDRR